MTGSVTTTERLFDLHGVAVGVCAEDPDVIGAMELRLRDFATGTNPDAELRLEFVFDGSAESELMAESARPVYDTPHGTLHYLPDADMLRGRLGRVELRCEPGRGAARFSSPTYDGLDLYLATHPLTTISLMELLERRGLFALHAACLASGPERGVLLAGASGAGKSTLALALAHDGMRFLSDDIVFLVTDPAEDAVRALGFADTIGLTEFAAAYFPALGPLRDGPPPRGFPKRLHRIEDMFGTPALRACRPCALVFPTVSLDEPSRIEPLDPGDAMVRLVPDVLLTDPAATQAHLKAIAALLTQARCYTLRSGNDLERAVSLLRGLL